MKIKEVIIKVKSKFNSFLGRFKAFITKKRYSLLTMLIVCMLCLEVGSCNIREPTTANAEENYNIDYASYDGINYFDISALREVTGYQNSITSVSDGLFSSIVITAVNLNSSNNNGSVSTADTLRSLIPRAVAGDTLYINADTRAYLKRVYINSTGTVWEFGTAITLTEEMLNSFITFYGYAPQFGQTDIYCTINNIRVTNNNGPYLPNYDIVSNYYYDIGNSEGYIVGFNNGFADGVNTSMGELSPFQQLVDGVDRFLSIELFGNVSLGDIFRLSFGLVLFGFVVKIFLGG